MTPHPPLAERRAAHAVPRPPFPRPAERARAGAFSLVEVTLAIGIMGFAFVSLLGLMPVGLSSFRQSKNISAASQIAQQIFAEVQSTPFAALTNSLPPGTSWRLPPPGSQPPATPGTPQTPTDTLRYFDEQAQEVSSTDPAAVASAIYQANVRVVVSTPFVQNAVSAGALAPNPALATVTIQVAYNPGNVLMDPATSDKYLWIGTAKSGAIAVPMFTYETLVARNF